MERLLSSLLSSDWMVGVCIFSLYYDTRLPLPEQQSLEAFFISSVFWFSDALLECVTMERSASSLLLQRVDFVFLSSAVVSDCLLTYSNRVAHGKNHRNGW